MNAATKLPGELGPIHFVGIGGIGMSGIAEVLMTLGYRVQGSDAKRSKITDRLETLGATVFEGQRAENLGEAGVVVISTAIKKGNPELEEARRRGLPVVRRAEMLAELMRMKSNICIAGTHGKTTTTTMVATLLDAGNLDPTVINGGVIHAYGSNARAGAGEWMVVEADESDGSFNRLPTDIAIITNIDPEHMEHWGSFDALRQGFYNFASSIPFYGLAVCCTDHAEVQSLVGRLTERRVVTFGFNAQADVRAMNLTYDKGIAHFDIALQGEGPNDKGAVEMIERCTLPMPGDHNVSNCLAAVAVARHLGMKKAEIREALAETVNVIVDAIRVALERTPPELSADIVDRGIVLTGGGSLLKNLDKRLREETGLPIAMAEDPLSSVVLGAGKMLSNFGLLRKISID